MCSNERLVSLESSIQALQNDGSLILQSGAKEALEAFEVPPMTDWFLNLGKNKKKLW